MIRPTQRGRWCRSSLYELYDSFCENCKPMRSRTAEIISSVAACLSEYQRPYGAMTRKRGGGAIYGWGKGAGLWRFGGFSLTL